MNEKKDPAILRAERLRAIQAMPEYRETIQQWLNDAKDDALYKLSTVQGINEFYTSQGAFNALNALTQQFDRVFMAEEAALNKKTKQKGTNA